MVIVNDPQIPDRTAYILDNSCPNPLPEMRCVANMLKEAGVDFIAMPCNTAHYFYEALSAAVEVPIINMLQETADCIVSSIGPGGTVGLLATQGTVSSGVFQDYLNRKQLNVRTPDEHDQNRVTSLIYDYVKANRPYDENEFLDLAHNLHDQECDAVVVGCTELSVIYQDLSNRPAWLFDSMDILANRCCELYLSARDSSE